MSHSTATEKPCSKCGLIKPLADFVNDKSGPNGKKSFCKGCRNVRTRKPPNLWSDRACKKCGVKKPHSDFGEYFSKGLGPYPHSSCKYCRAKQGEALREASKEQYAKTKKRWTAANPEKVKVNYTVGNHLRRARKQLAGGSFIHKEIEALYIRQGGRCHWTNKPLNGVFVIDHRIPLVDILPTDKSGGF